MNYNRICKKIDMPHPEQLIACEAAKLFHKSIIKKKPIQIHSLIKFPTHSRECQKISFNISPEQNELRGLQLTQV